MTPRIRKILDRCRETGDYSEFYGTGEWKETHAEVVRLDKGECQLCRRRGRFRRGEIAHHVNHLRDAPEWALSIFVPGTRERNIILVCKRCHEDEHPEALRQNEPKAAPLTPERWD